ncbi:ABC transporter ATP-binding protein [Pigmentibacter sp. JX0631]|uniref:ABC transporter ATP-binding protein n=1 Tax=Pigmentibacter sp. JX0631 TaxID=2976982 RepID=UPI002469637E|nr:ABC transporter ATP-binding protein [Pigmentibacter sp. JX0631]WGL60312.1 ABC transporter ATP-binding protein [Pigmentibacter sp. JX0631]
MLDIHVENYNYNKIEPVIKKIQVKLKKGEITSIIGASGCGKSTLLRVLMGMENGASGFIRTENQEFMLEKWGEKQNLFTLVPQIPHLLPWKNILENIAFVVTNIQVEKEKKSKREIALEALKLVQLDQHAMKYPNEISLGMAQRISFARALVMNSEAILLDEPFASLDAHSKHFFQQWLFQKITQTNKYAILVTHDVREALNLSKDIHVIGEKPAIIKKSFKNIINENEYLTEFEREIISYI